MLRLKADFWNAAGSCLLKIRRYSRCDAILPQRSYSAKCVLHHLAPESAMAFSRHDVSRSLLKLDVDHDEVLEDIPSLEYSMYRAI
jgi:hypothetical protein